MDPDATAKVVLITGASSGIGKEAARMLKKAGSVVYAAARRSEMMKDLENDGIRVLQLDLTDEHSIETCVKSIIEREGRIDILVNNAGYGSYGAIEDVPISEARRQFEVNLFGLARLTQAILPSMRAKRFGRIAEAIREAVAARTPRTRYAVGFGAEPMLILRRWLSDRMFDRLIKRAMV